MRDIPFVSAMLRRHILQNDPEKAPVASSAGVSNGGPPTIPAPVASPHNGYYNQSENAFSQGQHFPTSQTPIPVASSVHDFVPAHDRLAYFRRLVGIDSAPALTDTSLLQRRGPNVGIYTRTVHAETNCKQMFKTFSLGINGCLGLQIVVAATLTALGAAGGSRAAVTVFGAINTVIAGFLTYLKGSGLPNRFKYFESEWRKVREYIEQREREFGVELCTLNVEEEVRLIEAMYENVRADVEANVPDSYHSVTRANNDATGGRVAPLPGLGDQRRMTMSTLDGLQKSYDKELDRGHHGFAKGLDAVVKGIEKLEHKMNHTAERGQQHVQGEIARGQQAVQGGLSRSQSAVESTISRGQRTWDTGLERAHNSYHGGLERAQNSYHSVIDRGQQGVDTGMERGLAALHERLEMLDRGLDRVGLERRERDATPAVLSEEKKEGGNNSGPSS